MRALVTARRDDDTSRADLAARGGEHESLAIRVERRDRAARLNRRLEGIGPGREVADELGQVHVSVGVGTFVLATGQPDAPVGRDETERVPPPRPPRLRHATSLEHDMVDVGLLEKPAGRKAGLPRPDNRDIDS